MEIAYIDMNYYFSKGANANENIKNLISNTCNTTGGLIKYDESMDHFFSNIFTQSNLFKILFTDDLNKECDDLHHAIVNMRKCRFHWSPPQFKYKLDSFFRLNGLHYVTHTGETYFLTEGQDLELCVILRDSKKFTYKTDESITSLPLTEETFIENYVNNIDGFPLLSQLIIIELFYLHYNLEDDFLKYDLILEIIQKLEESDPGSPYILCCLLYAYLVLAKCMFSKLAKDDNIYEADYWPNE